jgi:flagellar biosynthesis/type III secretory pathway chaperone
MSEPMEERALTAEELKTLLLAERQARETRAVQQIQQILAQERCVMVPVIVIIGNTISSRIDVIARED